MTNLTLWGYCLQSPLKENATRQLRAIKQNAFQEAFQKWKKRWQPAIASGGTTSKGIVCENYVSYLIKLFYSQFGLFLNTPRSNKKTWRIVLE